MTAGLSPSEAAWWVRTDPEAEDPIAHQRLRVVIDRIVSAQDATRRSYLLHGAMYGGVDTFFWQERTAPMSAGDMSLNVTRNVVDAVTSRIASKAKPKLSYVTEGGDYEKQHNALQLERGVEGAFYQTEAYRKFTGMFRDGCVFTGGGHLRIFPDFDAREVRVQRMLPWERIFDSSEAAFYEPRSQYLRSFTDRGVLAWQYREEPEKAALIERLQGDRDDNDFLTGFPDVSQRVRIDEAWHRPSGKGAGDGRHVVAVANCTLLDEAWVPDDEAHPWDFTSYSWSDPLLGVHGQGLVEIGAPIQAEINKLVRQIQQGHHYISGHWMIQHGSKVVRAHLNNDLTAALSYTGTAPQYYAPAIISPEVYEHMWKLKENYYELAGVNQQTAAAQKPAGLDSGEAQRVYADQQTETLLEKGQRFEDAVRIGGQLVTRAAKALAKKGAYEVRAMSDDGFDTINWKELDDPDGFELRVAPTSSLPGTPSGKIDMAEDMMKLGEFDAGDILELIGMPDVLQKTRQKLASRKLVEKKIGLMLRKGEAWAPHAALNLDEAVSIARDMVCMGEEKDVDDERVQIVRDFIDACLTLKKAGAPPVPPQAQGPGGALLAPGAPPPIAMGAPPPPPMPGGMANAA